MKQVRVEARLRNNILWHAIYDVWESVSEFCRKKKLKDFCVGELLNLKRSPFDRFGNYTTLAKSCADALLMEPADLFPHQLYEKLLGGKMVREYSFAELPEAEEQLLLLSAPEDPFSETSSRELTRDLNASLLTLSPREGKAVGSYYGIGCEPKTMEEIARELGVTPARAQQIVRKGLLKLGAKPTTNEEGKQANAHGGLRKLNVERLRDFLTD